MKKLTLLAALAVVTVSALGQGHRRSVTPPAVVLDRDIASWTLDIRTSGGFATSLRSGVIARNTGDVTRLDYLGQSVCTGTTTADELDRLNAALGQAHPATWASSYARPTNPTGCCDQIHTKVTLQRTETASNGQLIRKTYTTDWFSAHPPLPLDLTDVYTRFFGTANEPAALFQRFASQCGPLF